MSVESNAGIEDDSLWALSSTSHNRRLFDVEYMKRVLTTAFDETSIKLFAIDV